MAAVSVRPNGTVGSVEILEAPHQDIAQAMVTAISQWTFPRVRLPGAHFDATVRSKVTYYFAIVNGRGIVRSPEDQAAFKRRAEMNVVAQR